QAEMTAYAVASYFDIDTSDYSLGYLANWTQGRELKDKAQLLEEVRGAAVEFMEIMEPELMKEQEKGVENGKDVFLQAIQERKDLSELTEVNKAAMDYVIDHKEKEQAEGLYFCVDGDVVVGVDNSTNEAWTEEFNHVVKCKAWLKRYDMDIEQPQIFIEWSEAPEIESDSMMDFAKGNAMMEKLEERYQGDNRYYKTRYSIIFPESKNSKMEVIDMDRLEVGDGEFWNRHHQARKEGDLTDEQQMMLDDDVYGHLLESERLYINDWLKGKNEKKKLQTVDMDMM